MTKTPQQEGRDFEVAWAKRVGGKPTPGSGAFWFSKLDVRDRLFRWSAKWTRANSFRLAQDELREALLATRGPGGDNAIPAMVVRVGSDTFTVVVMLAEDWLALMADSDTTYIPSTKADQRRALARTPILYREDS